MRHCLPVTRYEAPGDLVSVVTGDPGPPTSDAGEATPAVITGDWGLGSPGLRTGALTSRLLCEDPRLGQDLVFRHSVCSTEYNT